MFILFIFCMNFDNIFISFIFMRERAMERPIVDFSA